MPRLEAGPKLIAPLLHRILIIAQLSVDSSASNRPAGSHTVCHTQCGETDGALPGAVALRIKVGVGVPNFEFLVEIHMLIRNLRAAQCSELLFCELTSGDHPRVSAFRSRSVSLRHDCTINWQMD